MNIIRFLHRGVLLDTARHFQPLSIMYANLDAMAYNKVGFLIQLVYELPQIASRIGELSL